MAQIILFVFILEIVGYAKAFPQFGHNYNSVSRTVMYGWLNRHLGLGFPEPAVERDYRMFKMQSAYEDLMQAELTSAEVEMWPERMVDE